MLIGSANQQEKRVRDLARKEGFTILKSHARSINIDHQGEYMLLDPFRNIVLGESYDASLGEILEYLQWQP